MEAYKQPMTERLVLVLDRHECVVLQAALLAEPGTPDAVLQAIDRHLADFDPSTAEMMPGFRVVNGQLRYSADWL